MLELGLKRIKPIEVVISLFGLFAYYVTAYVNPPCMYELMLLGMLITATGLSIVYYGDPNKKVTKFTIIFIIVFVVLYILGSVYLYAGYKARLSVF